MKFDSYEAVWTLLHKLRRAMEIEGREKILGVVETKGREKCSRRISVVDFYNFATSVNITTFVLSNDIDQNLKP